MFLPAALPATLFEAGGSILRSSKLLTKAAAGDKKALQAYFYLATDAITPLCI